MEGQGSERRVRGGRAEEAGIPMYKSSNRQRVKGGRGQSSEQGEARAAEQGGAGRGGRLQRRAVVPPLPDQHYHSDGGKWVSDVARARRGVQYHPDGVLLKGDMVNGRSITMERYVARGSTYYL